MSWRVQTLCADRAAGRPSALWEEARLQGASQGHGQAGLGPEPPEPRTVVGGGGRGHRVRVRGS